LRYAFVLDAKEFTGSSLVYEATYASKNVGAPLPVRYAGSDPTINRYVADYFVTGGEGGFAALSLLLTALLPVAWSRLRSVRSALPVGYAPRKQGT
jgi:hypothetical protein